MATRSMLLCLALGAVTLILHTSCVTSAKYVLADDEGSAFALAKQQIDNDIRNERIGRPSPEAKAGYGWRDFWAHRLWSLENLVARGGEWAGPSRSSIAYIKQRRAEEGLPTAERGKPLMIR